MELLLYCGLDINAVGGVHGNALTAAALVGSPRCVELLLSKGANVNFQRWTITALHAAAAANRSDIASILIRHGADVNTVNEYGHTALYNAVQSSDSLELVSVLLEAGADPQFGVLWPGLLSFAAWNGSQTIVALLLDRGADPNECNGLPLQHALTCGYMNIFDLLVANGTNINSSGGAFWSPVSAATQSNDTMEVLMKKHQVDFGVRDTEGRTALHAAVLRTDDNTVLSRLLDLGLNVEESDDRGWSAIHYAALTNSSANLEIVLQYLTRKPGQQEGVWSPLHLACRENEPKAFDLLLAAGFFPTTIVTSDQNTNGDFMTLLSHTVITS